MNKVKITTIILTIIAITIIALGGIYIKDGNTFKNIVKEYEFSKDINGTRNIVIGVNTGTKTLIKDKDGKIVTDAGELNDEQLKEKGYIKEEKNINPQEMLNKENYQKSKEIIRKRLEKMQIGDYNIRLDEETGAILVELPEDETTDVVAGVLNSNGKFELIDAQTQETLMNNNDIKKVSVMYGQGQASQLGQVPGTTVYINIEFNKEGANKIKEISTNYKAIEKPEENPEEKPEEKPEENKEEIPEKKVTLKIDDEEIMTQAFEETIETGNIQLSVGAAVTDQNALNENIKRASNIAIALDSGALPINYSVSEQEFISSDIDKDMLNIIKYSFIIATALISLILIVKYKTNGIIGAISYMGLLATLTLVIKYTNVIISIDGMFAVAITIALNYLLIIKLLKIYKENKNEKEKIKNKVTELYELFLIKIIPVCITVIALCFINWIPISSFGMIMFWGILLIFVYNMIITNTLLKIKAEK